MFLPKTAVDYNPIYVSCFGIIQIYHHTQMLIEVVGVSLTFLPGLS
jgi:hypothetical protein